MEQNIRVRFREYLLGLVGQFVASTQSQNTNNCYRYVSEIYPLTIEDFIHTLPLAEQNLIAQNDNLIRMPLPVEFNVFLSNNEIAFH